MAGTLQEEDIQSGMMPLFTHFTKRETEVLRLWKAMLNDMNSLQTQRVSAVTVHLSSSPRLCKGTGSVNICKLDVWACGSHGCPESVRSHLTGN